MIWSQNYDPLGNLLVSAMLAAVPVILVLILLAVFHARAHWAAVAGLASALAIAILVYRMPVSLAFGSAFYGGLYGLFPIGWIVVTAIFVYEVTVETGQFKILRETIATIANDRRIQVLLIAFSFGAFIEGAAGFGTPVAISAAMLIGLGFRPLPAAGLALIGNTAPVAFGALGTPIVVLSQVTQLPLMELSEMVGRQLPIFSFIIPFWLIMAMVGWRETLRIWPACLVAGLSFALVQFAVSNFHGPWLVDIAGSVVSIVSLVALLRFWNPPEINPEKLETIVFPSTAFKAGEIQSSEVKSPRETQATLKALFPWILLTVMVTIWGLPQIKSTFESVTTSIAIPGLHELVQRVPPVSPTPVLEKAEFKLNWLSATGTALLLTGILAGLGLGLTPKQVGSTFLRTVRRTSLSLVTISLMLALGFTTRYSGLDSTMGLAFASTGFLFPFFSPLLGWLGVALTGSDTSSNILFGNLQQVTAERLGIPPVLAAAANSSGGVMGKMIDAQSIVVAGVATGQHGQEGTILRYVFFHSISLAVLVGLWVACQAYYLSAIVPVAAP